MRTAHGRYRCMEATMTTALATRIRDRQREGIRPASFRPRSEIRRVLRVIPARHPPGAFRLRPVRDPPRRRMER